MARPRDPNVGRGGGGRGGRSFGSSHGGGRGGRGGPGIDTPPLPSGHTYVGNGETHINLDQAPTAGGPNDPYPNAYVPPQESDPMADFLSQQRAEQAARERRIQQATQVLSQIFGGRSGAFDRFADETFALNRDRLQEQESEAARNLKFALARAGQMGGSVDVDKNAELEDRYNRGLVNARSYADEQAAQMRAQEQAAKNRLMGIASSGNVSSGDVSGMAQEALQSTQQAMQNPPVKPDLGQSFAGLASTIGQALAAHGMRQGNQMVPPGQQGFQSFFPNRRKNSDREEGTII